MYYVYRNAIYTKHCKLHLLYKFRIYFDCFIFTLTLNEKFCRGSGNSPLYRPTTLSLLNCQYDKITLILLILFLVVGFMTYVLTHPSVRLSI